MQSGLLFTTSPWFTLLCVVVGGLYAWLLYAPVGSWGKKVNLALAALRGLLVSIICFLLLGPQLRSIENTVDKARIVWAIDNSGSMTSAVNADVLRGITEASKALEEAGYDVSTVTLDGENQLDSLSFDAPVTDLGGMLAGIRSDLEGQNVTDVVLLSDGIVNQGASPAFGVYPFKVHSFAVGDTIPPKDIRITGVRANQVAFLGNQFPIQVDLSAFGMAGQQATLTLTQGQKVLATRPVKITGESFFETADFLVSSAAKGLQRFTLELRSPGGEKVQGTTRREVYVDIIDGRETILLLALSPHPDLKVFRSIVDQNENYELDIHILGLGSIPKEIENKKYDLVILHQIPDLLNLSNQQQVTTILQKEAPVWYFYGNQSAPAPFNKINRNVAIPNEGVQKDQVTGKFNKAFTTITFDPAKLSLLEKLPPVSVPFGSYSLHPGTEVVLFQRLGTLDTQKPLFTIHVSGEGKKSAAFVGDGLWRWRQEEFSQTGKTEVIDDLLTKTIQLLALKEDKRKFRVTPTAAEYTSREEVVLQTEVYNDLYERIFGQEVTLKLTDEEGGVSTYTYVNSEGQPHFKISQLKEGAYRFVATTTIKGKEEVAEGRFLVRDVDLEQLNQTADHGLLRELSMKSGGKFFYPDQLASLRADLVASKAPDRLQSTEEVVELIFLKWVFFLLVLLASIEWATRKYLGGY
jgi:hypothetical protein